MKNNNSQELRPVYIHETGYRADDEICLIDFALVLIRRKVVIASVFFFFIILGIAAILLIPKTYTYSTTIEIGKQVINDSIQAIESSQSLSAKLQYGYIPQTLSAYKLSHPDDEKQYKIKSSTPDIMILLLEIEGSEDKEAVLKTILQNISQVAIRDHSHQYQSVKESLEASLKATTQHLKAIESSSDHNTDTADILTVIETLKFQLSNLSNTRVVLQSVKSIRPTSMSPIAIIAISAFSGLLLGLLAAFFAEFAAKVKERAHSSPR